MLSVSVFISCAQPESCDTLPPCRDVRGAAQFRCRADKPRALYLVGPFFVSGGQHAVGVAFVVGGFEITIQSFDHSSSGRPSRIPSPARTDDRVDRIVDQHLFEYVIRDIVSYFPMMSLAIVCNCMFDVPS